MEVVVCDRLCWRYMGQDVWLSCLWLWYDKSKILNCSSLNRMFVMYKVCLAKEAGISYTSIALATDYDSWKEDNLVSIPGAAEDSQNMSHWLKDSPMRFSTYDICESGVSRESCLKGKSCRKSSDTVPLRDGNNEVFQSTFVIGLRANSWEPSVFICRGLGQN